jgi:hypothetical protein
MFRSSFATADSHVVSEPFVASGRRSTGLPASSCTYTSVTPGRTRLSCVRQPLRIVSLPVYGRRWLST